LGFVVMECRLFSVLLLYDGIPNIVGLVISLLFVFNKNIGSALFGKIVL
jgi:hypothetical protein